jgi:hypothetical protein
MRFGSLLTVSEPSPSEQTRTRKWKFVRIFRWIVTGGFLAFVTFLAICIVTGIAANLHWRYTDLDLPEDRPDDLAALDSLALRDCLTALEQLNQEQIERFQQALSGQRDRDTLLSSWTDWSKTWGTRFEKLAISCRLREGRSEEHPALGLIAKTYSLVDYFHKTQTRWVHRFVTENSEPLKELRELFRRTHEQIEQLEGKPTGP